jgi:hypothetical protein
MLAAEVKRELSKGQKEEEVHALIGKKSGSASDRR